MKVKNKSICQTCRTRKLGCDGLQPECSQCAFSGRACGGYQTSWTFVDSSSPVSTAKRKKRSQIKYDRDENSGLEHICAQQNSQRDTMSCSKLVYSQTSHFTGPSQDECIALIVQSYVPRATAIADSNNGFPTTSYPRICGAWVEVLPNLSNEGAGAVVLDTAIQALATSIITQKLHPNRDDILSFQRYELALRTLRRKVAVDQLFDSRILASIMCLSLVELMMPSTSVSLQTHLNGASRLFQAYGPNAFKMGEIHILFAGFRPLLLLEAFQSRQPTFLSSSSWIRVPFSVTAPSHMQSLLSQAAGIPSLLNQSDTLLKELPRHSSNDERVSELTRSFCDVLNDLERWEEENCQDSSYRWCYRPHDSVEPNTTPAERACRYSNLQFTSVTAANIHTNLWAFRIICLTEVQRLFDRVDYSDLSQTVPLLRPLSLTQIPAYKVILAQQISASMEYLLSDEMSLFGPASTYFPLQIAYEVFLGNQDRWHQEITFVEYIVKRLVAKGLRSAPVLVTTRKSMRTAVSP